ncbi:formin-binding protein 4-like isoform X1 [Diorhabda sublineata]|uniref:formin-binding protein 4-like isoform X1 n=2 Tax=Diorhabda sublineata TaxID=1163346 RepID=UPI0024E13D86|nr:formin-binding protein 4-like isoform X1 [Diorhabda sublineata]
MECKVNDFLNEINEIAPPPSNADQDEVWKQCFDELTGYPYYWNKNTDEVTWNQPKSFEKNYKPPSKITPDKNHILNKEIRPPSSNSVPKDLIKIYSVGETMKQMPKKPVSKLDKKQTKRKYPKGDDSDDEKIVLISSYGTDSESEDDTKKAKKDKKSVDSDKYNSEEDDDFDILAKIQKRAQELKELGGDIPVEVKEVVETSKRELLEVPKNGPSLVASYCSDSEEENDEIKKIFPNNPEPVQVSHSTLFPITKPINVKDFVQSHPDLNTDRTSDVDKTEIFDAKLFKRKKKIAVPFVGPVKKDNQDGESRKGLGYDKENKSTEKNSNGMYLGFRKGGVEFVKSDVLNPPVNNVEENSVNKSQDDKETEEIENMYSILKDKLLFLNEGRPTLSSVQSMVIQAETLMTALNDGALKGSYIKKWLEDTCSEMKKLEKEAAPTGWVLQWDKIHRRYFYQNKQNGTSQWEYPQPDTNTNDVAMDISTTPPPVLDIEPEELSPPLPPVLRSPSPPPPPIISIDDAAEIPLPNYDVPLDVDAVQLVSQKVELNGQPLPPGVDPADVATAPPQQTVQLPQEKDSLNSALDSFYSDIAAISSPLPQPEEANRVTATVAPVLSEIPAESVKKKKKVKLISNLGMKKKGVSQLVEKWRSVQQEYKN